MGEDSNRTNLRFHFEHRLAQDAIMILEYGNQPSPRCPKCDMFVSHKALNGRHLATTFFCRVDDRNQRLLAEEEAQAVTDFLITSYGIPLVIITSFIINY